MILHARIERRGRWFWPRSRVQITATCSRSGGLVADPMIGCGRCHAPLNFTVYHDSPSSDEEEAQ